MKNAENIDVFNKALNETPIKNLLDAQEALPSSMDEKHNLCKMLVHYVLVDSVEFLIDELKEGLRTLGLLESIQKHPEEFRAFFCNENAPKLDAEMVGKLFALIDYDEKESVNRASQEKAIVYWLDYLQDCAGMLQHNLLIYIN